MIISISLGFSILFFSLVWLRRNAVNHRKHSHYMPHKLPQQHIFHAHISTACIFPLLVIFPS